MTLGKKEKLLMQAVFNAADKYGKCIISPVELLKKIPYDARFAESDLSPTIKALTLEEYFTLEEAVYGGEKVYCITLLPKGKSYERDRQKSRKTIIKSLILAAATALVGALIKVIVSAILPS